MFHNFFSGYEIYRHIWYTIVEVNGERPPADSDDEEEAEYYNKTKSFFDNISCEASDRAAG